MTAERGTTQKISSQQMVQLLTRSIAAQPHNPDNYVKLGLLLAQQGNEEKAEEYFKQALARDQKLFPAHVQLGMIYFRRYVKQVSDQTALAQALQSFRLAQKIQPDAPQVLEKLGIVLRFLGQNEESIDCFTQLVRLLPENPWAHYRLGVVLSESDRHEDALRHLDETLHLDPNFLGAYASKAAKLERMNRLDDAWQAVETGLALAPDDSSLLARNKVRISGRRR